MRIPITKPTVTLQEINAVIKTLKSGYLVQGPVTEQLEQAFAQLCGTTYAAALNSGTAALHAALYALQIGPDDEVITTSFTFAATVNAILMVGARPIFVDIDEDTYNIDDSKIESAITKKTKAILPVNLYGQPANYDSMRRLAKKYGLAIVEDAAQSIGSLFKNRNSGNLGDIGCFSLYATKNIMCGEGGMITTNNKSYWERVRRFRNHGQSEHKRYYYEDIGYNYRLPDMLSSIALTQIKKLSSFTAKRQAIARRYTKALHQIKGIKVPFTASQRSHVFHQYTIRITSECKITRDQLKNILEKRGVATNIYYPKGLFEFPHMAPQKKYMHAFLITQQATQQVLSLPIYPTLSNKQVDYIINQIKKVC